MNTNIFVFVLELVNDIYLLVYCPVRVSCKKTKP